MYDERKSKNDGVAATEAVSECIPLKCRQCDETSTSELIKP